MNTDHASPLERARESVWDYRRPPAMVPSDRIVRVEFGGMIVAETRRAVRVLETAGAPVWYLPPDDVRRELLRPAPDRRTVCEWKGLATYVDLVVGQRISRQAAWTYPKPYPGYEAITGYLAFYAARVDSATVDGEPVRPQPGGYYGGWITDDVIGPSKGEPGTEGW